MKLSATSCHRKKTLPHCSEDGYALILSLVFLLLLTILGIGSSTNTMFELQISGNDRSRKTAFYAAEAGRAFVQSSSTLYDSANIAIGPESGIGFPDRDDQTVWLSLPGAPSEMFQGQVAYTGPATRFLRGTGNEAGTTKAHVYQITSNGKDIKSGAQKSIEAGFFRVGL